MIKGSAAPAALQMSDAAELLSAEEPLGTRATNPFLCWFTGGAAGVEISAVNPHQNLPWRPLSDDLA